MSEATQVGFVVQCEVPGSRVVITSGNQEPVPIPFNVTRRTRPGEPGPARIEAHIMPQDGSALPQASWQGWLSLEGEREQAFDDDGFRSYTVWVRLPAEGLAPLGEYRFTLRVLGVDDPDEQFAETDEVIIEVKGREPKALPYVIMVLIALLIVAGAAIGGVLYLMNRATLAVDLSPPTEAVAGQAAPYTLSVRNTRPMTLTHVSLHYTPPLGVLDVTAQVDGSSYRRCVKQEAEVECELGPLAGHQSAIVRLQIVPGPGTETITHTEVMTLTYLESRLKTRPVRPPRGKETTTVITPTGLTVVSFPSVGRAVVDEVVTVEFVAWDSTSPPTATLSAAASVTPTQLLTATRASKGALLVYELPQGWRYAHDPPADGCIYDGYFGLRCPLGALDPRRPDRVSLDLVPSQVTVQPAVHTAYAIDGQGRQSSTQLIVPVAETDLYFDGQDDYAELGYQGTPEALTVELWVHPYSVDDGQALIGVHDPEGANLLLIGYYEGGLHVNLRDTRTTIAGAQRTTRHHLAVVVNPVGGARSEISVFVDGKLQARPAVVDAVLDPNLKTRNWVLGQDWDRGPSGPLTSDLFSGRLGGVRLWAEARTPGAILDGMNRTLSADEIRASKTLIGDWPLVPAPNAETPRLVDRVSQVRGGTDRSGERCGASWQALPPHFGLTLQFDGVDDVAHVPELILAAGQTAQARGPLERTAVSLAAWVYVDELPSSAQWIVGHVSSQPGLEERAVGQTAAVPRWGALIVDRRGYPAVVARQGGREVWVELPDRKPIPVRQWVHYTGIITYSADAPPVLALYRDGLDVRNDTLPQSDRVGLNVRGCLPGVYVGGLCPEARAFYRGRVDDIRIWERALPADEVGRWRTRPGEFYDEVAYWPLNDGPGRQDAPGTCTLDQSCNVRVSTPGTADGSNDRYHLPVWGPAWVEADFGVANLQRGHGGQQ